MSEGCGRPPARRTLAPPNRRPLPLACATSPLLSAPTHTSAAVGDNPHAYTADQFAKVVAPWAVPFTALFGFLFMTNHQRYWRYRAFWSAALLTLPVALVPALRCVCWGGGPGQRLQRRSGEWGAARRGSAQAGTRSSSAPAGCRALPTGCSLCAAPISLQDRPGQLLQGHRVPDA